MKNKKDKNDDVVAMLTVWLEKYKAIESVYKKSYALFGCQPESEWAHVIHDTFDCYTEALSKAIGDREGWLDWFIYENGAGSKGLEAKSSKNNKLKKIKTINDLAELIK